MFGYFVQASNLSKMMTEKEHYYFLLKTALLTVKPNR